jgi:murein DD-endopeptidase MepM/ murein hydrolase activator NlpD
VWSIEEELAERTNCMISKRRINFYSFAVLAALLLNFVGLSLVSHASPLSTKKSTSVQSTSAKSLVHKLSEQLPVPFMHRPFYGNQTIADRTVSYFDHDHPWYDQDGIFVRYDGKKWLNTPIGSCVAGENCYDGHNGYDLNLHFEPVLSAAAGTITSAGWYNPLNHNDGFGLWVAINHGNGYGTAYGHLSAITVAVGDKVGIQQRIATSGTSGSSTGPHLHMSTYYLPSWKPTDPFGWSGNYANPNVVPDHYLWVSQPGSSATVPVLSSNGNKVYPGATLVNDGDKGFTTTGTWQKALAATNVKGDMHWTGTTSGSATASATWQTKLSKSGEYEVGFFVDDNNASSSWVPITVYSADPTHPGAVVRHTIHLDESHIGTFQSTFGTVSTGAQWVSLGTFYFHKGTTAQVMVTNATGEDGQQLGVDGVEFAPLS